MTAESETPTELEFARAIITLDSHGRFLDDPNYVRLARAYADVHAALDDVYASHQQVSDKAIELRAKLMSALKARDLAVNEQLPTGWYWAEGETVRARHIDGKRFCEPRVGGHERAVGLIDANVARAVETRAHRLAAEASDDA